MASKERPLQIHRLSFKAMGSACEVVLASASQKEAETLAKLAIDEVLRIERKYSRYTADSIVAIINQQAGHAPVRCDDESWALFQFASQLFEKSDGLFDITSGVLRRVWDFKNQCLPTQESLDEVIQLIGWHRVEREGHSVRLPECGMELDFGGFGKEYAADRAAQALREHGATGGYVNLGGDIAAIGPQEDGTPWQIGINDPRDLRQLIATIPLTRGGLATSGDYERYFDLDGQRYCHILNAHTGQPVRYWRSVSVLAPMCIAAGALS
jgi:thiamine biosynthesis lipoprotein